ncbi:MAG: PKD domain-containing protein [Ferruginibacter sp.]
MKRTSLFILAMTISAMVYTQYSGGEIYYSYVGGGSSPTSHVYKITLKLYQRTMLEAFPYSVPITVSRIINPTQPQMTIQVKQYAVVDGPHEVTYFPAGRCFYPPSDVRYYYALYTTTVELQESSYGFIIAYQRCCRDSTAIGNIATTSKQGHTFYTKIPGKLNTTPSSVINSSPRFQSDDSILVCSHAKFTMNFGAVDDDGDLLSYQFTPVLTGGGSKKDGIGCSEFRPDPACFPYDPCKYNDPYSGTKPMGSSVTIDPVTGVISGVSPGKGEYALGVLCYEKRGDVIIGYHYKEFVIRVTDDCKKPGAYISPKPVYCDSATVHFMNEAPENGLPLDYYWDFGDATSANNYSTLATPSHTFSTAGTYNVKLKVSVSGICTDSAETIIKVYPGYKPGFSVSGKCAGAPVQFTDTTHAGYGNIIYRMWDFADPGPNGTSTLPNPVHTYNNVQDYTITLKTITSVGCSSEIQKVISIYGEPVIPVFPKDTLICDVDTIRIAVPGAATALWSPNYMISDVQSISPYISPDITTVYTVALTDTLGCKTTGTVKVNVTDRVRQGSNYDTVVCTTDAILLRLNSDALYFNWQPNDGTINNNRLKNPVVKIPSAGTTLYTVTGKISDKCFAENSIRITAVPYPVPVAPDVHVCAGESVQLQASGGSMYNWNPPLFLNNAFIANPVAVRPAAGVAYTLTVRDVLGCPKPVQKTVRLFYVKPVIDAGPPDTSVVTGQPLQLHASGGKNYLWLPDNRWLSDINIANPVAMPENNIRYIVQATDSFGCKGNDTILVKLFRLAPGIYVPNAFTPNGDGRNDLFRPVLLGIRSLELFQVYNRFGQLLYSSNDATRGWDGKYGGRMQDAATYTWIARATDFTGKQIVRTGTVIMMNN